jgi:hypothetical protein
VLFKKGLALIVAVAATVSVAACSEKIEAGTSCPLLCPQQAITLRDTIIDAVVADTTIAGLPPIGSEEYLMLASYGDTLETRAIIRYDTLPQSYTKAAVDSTIATIDTAQLVVPVLLPDSSRRPRVPITIEAYNVDTTGADTVTASLAPLFRANRLLGSKTFTPDSLKDTLRIPLSTDSVLARVKSGARLRIGLRIVSSVGVDLRIGSTNGDRPVTLRLKVSKDTTVAPLSIVPLSRTPEETFIAGPLADYTIILKGLTATPRTLLAVGGVPSRRVFLRFDVPSRIVDSTTIVRASLLLTQSPNRRILPRDSVFVYPQPILAGPSVTDFTNALLFLGGTGLFGLDSLKLAPGDSGVRSFEIVGLVRTWRQQAATVSPRTLALVSGAEGQLPIEIDFFSTKAPAAVRPRLRITYVPQSSYGVP